MIGQSSCTACPAGFYCPSTSSIPQLCSTGTYATGSATSCTSYSNPTYGTQIASSGSCSAPTFNTQGCPSKPLSGKYASSGNWYSCGSTQFNTYTGSLTACTTATTGKSFTSQQWTPSTCIAGSYSTTTSVGTTCSATPRFYSSTTTATTVCTNGLYL